MTSVARIKTFSSNEWRLWSVEKKKLEWIKKKITYHDLEYTIKCAKIDGSEAKVKHGQGKLEEVNVAILQLKRKHPRHEEHCQLQEPPLCCKICWICTVNLFWAGNSCPVWTQCNLWLLKTLSCSVWWDYSALKKTSLWQKAISVSQSIRAGYHLSMGETFMMSQMMGMEKDNIDLYSLANQKQ